MLCGDLRPEGVEGETDAFRGPVLRRGESVLCVLSRPFPIEGTGKERQIHGNSNGISVTRKNRRALPLARPLAGSPRKKEWRGRSMKKIQTLLLFECSLLLFRAWLYVTGTF